jgi:hypothetical protein
MAVAPQDGACTACAGTAQLRWTVVCYDAGMNAQLMLFETIQTDNGDGSFTVRPKAVRVTREVRAKRAAKMLGVHVETIHRLCDLGEAHGGLKAYKLPSARGNAPWRIDWEFLVGYKARREAVR